MLASKGSGTTGASSAGNITRAHRHGASGSLDKLSSGGSLHCVSVVYRYVYQLMMVEKGDRG